MQSNIEGMRAFYVGDELFKGMFQDNGLHIGRMMCKQVYMICICDGYKRMNKILYVTQHDKRYSANHSVLE